MANGESRGIAVPIASVAAFAAIAITASCQTMTWVGQQVDEVEAHSAERREAGRAEVILLERRQDRFDSIQQTVIAHHVEPQHSDHIRQLCREMIWSDSADRFTGKDATAHERLVEVRFNSLKDLVQRITRELGEIQGQIDGLEGAVYERNPTPARPR